MLRGPRATVILLAVVVFVLVIALRPNMQTSPGSSFPHLVLQKPVDTEPIRHLRIAVVEQSAHHEEVIGAVVTVLHDLGANFTLHRMDFWTGFDEVIRDVYPKRPNPIKEMEYDLKAGRLDVVVSTTCDSKFWWDWRALRDKIFDARVRFICVAHEIEGFDNDRNKEHLVSFAKEGRLGMVTLADHSKNRINEILTKWAGEDPDWANVPIIDFAPVYSLPAHMRVVANRKYQPSSAAILGRMQDWSRRYNEIFSDLVDAINAEPDLWGYRLVERNPSDPSRSTIQRMSEDAFQLHLIGKPDTNPLAIPPMLVSTDDINKVVVIHENANYATFYQLIGLADLVLPAFKKRLYYDHRASAAIPAAIISRTSVLASEDLHRAYPYIAPPALVLHESGLSEVKAIAELRRKGSKALMSGEAEWKAYEDKLSRDNMESWVSILAPR